MALKKAEANSKKETTGGERVEGKSAKANEVNTPHKVADKSVIKESNDKRKNTLSESKKSTAPPPRASEVGKSRASSEVAKLPGKQDNLRKRTLSDVPNRANSQIQRPPETKKRAVVDVAKGRDRINPKANSLKNAAAGKPPNQIAKDKEKTSKEPEASKNLKTDKPKPQNISSQVAKKPQDNAKSNQPSVKNIPSNNVKNENKESKNVASSKSPSRSTSPKPQKENERIKHDTPQVAKGDSTKKVATVNPSAQAKKLKEDTNIKPEVAQSKQISKPAKAGTDKSNSPSRSTSPKPTAIKTVQPSGDLPAAIKEIPSSKAPSRTASPKPSKSTNDKPAPQSPSVASSPKLKPKISKDEALDSKSPKDASPSKSITNDKPAPQSPSGVSSPKLKPKISKNEAPKAKTPSRAASPIPSKNTNDKPSPQSPSGASSPKLKQKISKDEPKPKEKSEKDNVSSRATSPKPFPLNPEPNKTENDKKDNSKKANISSAKTKKEPLTIDTKKLDNISTKSPPRSPKEARNIHSGKKRTIATKIPVMRKIARAYPSKQFQDLSKSSHYLNTLHARAKRAGLITLPTIKHENGLMDKTDLPNKSVALPEIDERNIRAEYEVEKTERIKLAQANADLHHHISTLQKRLLKEQEKAKQTGKITSIIPTSLEHQYQRSLEVEREKYSALENENVRLVRELQHLSLEKFKDKKALSLDEEAQHRNEVAFWRSKVRELELDKEASKKQLIESERKLAKEVKEKNRLFKEIVTVRRLHMHVSSNLGPMEKKSKVAMKELDEDDEASAQKYLKSIGVDPSELISKKRESSNSKRSVTVGKNNRERSRASTEEEIERIVNEGDKSKKDKPTVSKPIARKKSDLNTEQDLKKSDQVTSKTTNSKTDKVDESKKKPELLKNKSEQPINQSPPQATKKEAKPQSPIQSPTQATKPQSPIQSPTQAAKPQSPIQSPTLATKKETKPQSPKEDKKGTLETEKNSKKIEAETKIKKDGKEDKKNLVQEADKKKKEEPKGPSNGKKEERKENSSAANTKPVDVNKPTAKGVKEDKSQLKKDTSKVVISKEEQNVDTKSKSRPHTASKKQEEADSPNATPGHSRAKSTPLTTQNEKPNRNRNRVFSEQEQVDAAKTILEYKAYVGDKAKEPTLPKDNIKKSRTASSNSAKKN